MWIDIIDKIVEGIKTLASLKEQKLKELKGEKNETTRDILSVNKISNIVFNYQKGILTLLVAE